MAETKPMYKKMLEEAEQRIIEKIQGIPEDLKAKQVLDSVKTIYGKTIVDINGLMDRFESSEESILSLSSRSVKKMEDNVVIISNRVYSKLPVRFRDSIVEKLLREIAMACKDYAIAFGYAIREDNDYARGEEEKFNSELESLLVF